MVLPLVSVCSKDYLNFFVKSSKVSRKRVAEAKANFLKVNA